MRQARFLHRKRLGLIAAVSLAALLISGCRGPEVGSRDQISVVSHRWFDDDGVVRVVGLARNSGDLPTPVSEVLVTLHSRTGSFQGQNRVKLSGLEPGAEEKFALAVDAHGRVARVDIEIIEPGTVAEQDGGEAPDNSTEEGDDDDA